MSRWFRVYDDILDDPKVQLLSPELFKTWVNILALASRNKGLLPAQSAIAFALRISAQDAQARIDELILAGLVDILPDGNLQPHNWQKRQFVSDGSTERVRKHREKRRGNVSCNVSSAVSETPPDTETETETEKIPPTPLAGGRDDVGLRPDDRGEMPAHVKPVADMRTVFGVPDDGSGISIEPTTGAVRLTDRARREWVGLFGDDAGSLDLALIEVAGQLQPHSRRSMAAQVSSQLARIARDKRGRDARYREAVDRNKAPARSGQPPTSASRAFDALNRMAGVTA